MTSQGELGSCYSHKRQAVAMATTGTRMTGRRKQRRHAEAQKRSKKIKEVKNVQASKADVPDYVRQEVESCYQLKMPEDFYHFWKFCEELEPDKPCDIFEELHRDLHHEISTLCVFLRIRKSLLPNEDVTERNMQQNLLQENMNETLNKNLSLDTERQLDALKSSIGLQLVGPYDILSGKHKSTNKSKDINFNLHWRFFYDPPEFQTIITGDSKTQYHMGYFRDIPDHLPVWVGETETQKGCTIYQVGDNIFAAVKLFLSKKLKELTNKKRSGLLRDADEKLTQTAKQLGYSLEQKSLNMKERDNKVVTKTFHGAGLVVPVDKNNVGYRKLPETNSSLKRICKAIVDAPNDDQRLKAFAPIQEMLTFIQFANDECDYGMGYELGIDLFCYGSHYFHNIIGQLLPLAYSLLKRSLFAEIIEAHLANRRKEKVDLLVA